MTLDRAKTITDIATAWLGAIALAAGGAFAVYQYLEKEKGDRVKESLTFLDRFNKEPFSSARQKIAAVWERHADRQNAILETPSYAASEYNGFILSVIRAESIGSEVLLLVDFFETLEICVLREICDSEVAILLFQPEARALYNQHYAKIASEREQRQDPSLARSLQSFCQRTADR